MTLSLKPQMTIFLKKKLMLLIFKEESKEIKIKIKFLNGFIM